MEKVSLVQCKKYSPDILKEKIVQSFANIGFDPGDFSGARVALKPNLLLPAKPETAVNTHHEFFRAVIQIVKSYNGIPVLIESPAFHSIKRTIAKTPYSEVVESEGIEVADSSVSQRFSFVGSKSHKSIHISKAFFDVDFIVNLPKFKTHSMTYITCSVKNLFGVMPGLSKSRTHMRQPLAKDFSAFLVDLHDALKLGFETPKKILHVVDAIIAQEGEGPGLTGTPRVMNAIIVGQDAVAVDYVAAEVAGIKYYKVPTITRGFKKGACINGPEEVEVVGDRVEDLRVLDFKPPSGNPMANITNLPFASKRIKNLFMERPFPLEEKCTLCLQCKKICPAEAIRKPERDEKIPKYDYNKCIRCYCCLEICSEAAIVKKKGRLQFLKV